MPLQKLFVLYEHAAGYSLFHVKEFEEIGISLPQVRERVKDLSRFRSVVTLVGFAPFKTAVAALENINSISEGIITDDLKIFLDSCLPESTKQETVILGVADPKLGVSINEALGIKCDHLNAVPEIIRGIRFHFHNLVKGFTPQTSTVSQLGLGHSYSRVKIKFNVNRVDNMIIQCISLLDQLDKDINTFSMRLREWYGYHFPELVKIVPENYMYAKVVLIIKNKKGFLEKIKDIGVLEKNEDIGALEDAIMDLAKAQAIVNAMKSSHGMDISPVDLMNSENFASRIISLTDYRKKMATYLTSKMTSVAPNLATLIGDQVGARLIAHAGSLTNLAKVPSSTLQILGAEKALFRALKSRGKSNTPKYGLLFHSTFVGRAVAKDKGRIARFLANKCSIATRFDCFGDGQTNFIGKKLREQTEDRLLFFTSGKEPKKNIDAMREALDETRQMLAEQEAARKKGGKRKRSEIENGHDANGEADTTLEKQKKKKKRKTEEERLLVSASGKEPKKNIDAIREAMEETQVLAEQEAARKKSGKGKQSEIEDGHAANGEADTTLEKQKKKKKRKTEEERLLVSASGKEPKKNIDAIREAMEETPQVLAEQEAARKKSGKGKQSEIEDGHAANGEADTTLEKKKKKKKKEEEERSL